LLAGPTVSGSPVTARNLSDQEAFGPQASTAPGIGGWTSTNTAPATLTCQ